MPIPKVELYCDGGCYPANPGLLSAWGCVLKYRDATKTLYGALEEMPTTNIRSEMRAAIEGLKALKAPCEVTIYSDLQTLVRGGNRDQGRGANMDLWRLIDDLMVIHTVRFTWIKGHNLHPDQERCHDLVQQAIREYSERKPS